MNKPLHHDELDLLCKPLPPELLNILDDTPRSATSKSRNRQARKLAKTEKTVAKVYAPKPFKALNAAQATYMDMLDQHDQVFALGGAGTGKTYVAARHAIRGLMAGKCERIYLTRPTVSKPKHRMGYLPGDADDKIGPWLTPILDGMRDEVSNQTIDKMRKDGRIVFVPFEFMRGRTLRGAIIILDEAQNCDLSDLRLFLTRTGEHSQVIISGDTDQVDIPDSGLATIVAMARGPHITAGVVEFGPDDVVRSGIAKEWVAAFSRANA